jgi:hypothetical protein
MFKSTGLSAKDVGIKVRNKTLNLVSTNVNQAVGQSVSSCIHSSVLMFSRVFAFVDYMFAGCFAYASSLLLLLDLIIR